MMRIMFLHASEVFGMIRGFLCLGFFGVGVWEEFEMGEV